MVQGGRWEGGQDGEHVYARGRFMLMCGKTIRVLGAWPGTGQTNSISLRIPDSKGDSRQEIKLNRGGELHIETKRVKGGGEEGGRWRGGTVAIYKPWSRKASWSR